MRLVRHFVSTALLASLYATAHAEPAGTAFTYQAQLKQDGVPISEACDFEFSLWNDPTSIVAQDQVGSTLTFDGLGGNPGPIQVTNGLFSVDLDFGASAFNGDARWLEVAVVCPTGGGIPVPLSPRDAIRPTPYAIQTRGLFVDDAGRVGIGTTQPGESLQVSGNIALAVEGYDPYIELRSNDAADSTTVRLKSLDAVGFAVTDSRDNERLVVTDGGNVGIGTASPQTFLHVEGPGTFAGNHIAFFDSTRNASADGIAIRLANEHTNRGNNYLTFLNGQDLVTGRIEGFDLENGDWVIPPPLPTINMTFDPAITYNPNWFNPGSLPTASFNRGQLPTASLSPGTLPNLSFSGGSLPTLTFSGGSLPSASFSPGTLPSVSWNDGSLPSLSPTYTTILGVRVVTGFSWSAGSTPSLTFNDGSLPSLTFNRGSLPTATFSPGSLPTATFSRGSLPSLTFSGGQLPTLSFSGGSLPSLNSPPITIGEPSLTFDLPTREELEALFCWSLETGNSDFLTLDPVALAVAGLKQEVAKTCKDEGVTYGSKGADYAEWLPKLNPTDRFQMGQIIGVHGGKISLKTEGAEQIMAISRAPVVVGNVPPESEKDDYATVGFMGQLPVVVRGKVKAGDYIIPSGLEDGTAAAVSPEDLALHHLGRTLGRAWSNSDNEVYGLVNVVIGLPGHEAKIILERHHDRMNAQARQQVALSAENTRLKVEMDEMNVRLAGMMTAMQGLEELVRGGANCDQTVVRTDRSGATE